MTQALATERPKSRSTQAEADLPTRAASARLADFALIVSFLALTFLLGIFPLKDTDFWWHLKAGNLIRQTGQVPTVDTFTYGAAGHPWVDLHWVFQVLLSWGYEHVGVVGLNLAKCAITTLAVALLITSKRREWPVWVMHLAWLPSLLVLNGRMYIRPETISLLYLAIVLAILFRWDRAPWLAFGLPVVQACWVNTQGLFLLEPILIGFALIDAATRPGALATERRGWWRVVGLATALTAGACLLNPYGLTGALYPIQLAKTMSDPIFKNSIGELKPLLKFVEEVGLDSLPLQLHLVAFCLGGASFLLPLCWRTWVVVADRGRTPEVAADLPKGRKKRDSSKARKKSDEDLWSTAESWRLSLFRALMFSAFSALSLAATRNSHQFAAVVGTVTAWNFAEWAGAIRARHLRLHPSAKAARSWPRLVAFAAIALTFTAVASGRFYDWAGEGRTVGIGEEPLWFPHEAVKFAGGTPGMPDRLAGFHNGHPALYEYEWGPEKKVYTDARLEVMGPELYKKYHDLSEKIRTDKGGWARELEEQGRPAVLVDNIDQGNAGLSATLLIARHWRCVWFDPIASVFVHDSYAKVANEHAVDFAALHFRPGAVVPSNDPATLTASSRALRYIGTQCRARAEGQRQARALFLLGLDDARRLRAIDPDNVDGWKQAGLIEQAREFNGEEVIPRFRFAFDPVFDLSPARATYDLSRALAIEPQDHVVQYFLAKLFLTRGMDEPAVAHLETFAELPNRNLPQRKEKALAKDQLTILRAKLGAPPSTKWANLSELDRVVAELRATGRASTLADVMEAAYRPEARPWEWADRLAVLRLHLGEPAKARATWLAATANAPAATRLARIAATYLVEGDLDASRRFYREAIAADPASFEAHYGLAQLELDAGRAVEATEQGRLAEKAATAPHARAAARAIVEAASPYATEVPPKESAR